MTAAPSTGTGSACPRHWSRRSSGRTWRRRPAPCTGFTTASRSKGSWHTRRVPASVSSRYSPVIGRPRVVAAFALLLLAYVAMRTYHLTRLPIFIDESLHLFWSLRVQEGLELDRPLRDGKPLQAL